MRRLFRVRKLLREAADEIDQLRDELGVMRARGGDRARLTCPHCPGEIEELPVLRCIKCGCGYYDEVGGRVR